MDDRMRRFQEDGYVVLPGALSASEIELMRSELAPHFQHFGRNPFEGERTQRAYALLAKAPSLARLVEHPEVLAIVDRVLAPTYLLWAAIAINVHPGETAQSFHCDDDAGAPSRPRAPQGVSVIWALDDFTETNGATELVPGSHLWGPGETPEADDPRAVQALLKAGSVMVWAGPLFHRGGANRSDQTRLGITVQYCQPWLRQVENMVLAVPPEKAAQYSPRIREMLGYGLMGTSFIGYVDGRNPARLVAVAAGEETSEGD